MCVQFLWLHLVKDCALEFAHARNLDSECSLQKIDFFIAVILIPSFRLNVTSKLIELEMWDLS